MSSRAVWRGRPTTRDALPLACAHARAGRPDEALSHLAQAVELQESFAEYARSDDDLVSRRDDPRFPAA